MARTVGTLLGKARRYVSDIEAEINPSMNIGELRKMKDTVQEAARDVEQSIQNRRQRLRGASSRKRPDEIRAVADTDARPIPSTSTHARTGGLKQGATPQWYKARNGVRTKALSGAARASPTASQNQLAQASEGRHTAPISERSVPTWPIPQTRLRAIERVVA